MHGLALGPVFPGTAVRCLHDRSYVRLARSRIFFLLEEAL